MLHASYYDVASSKSPARPGSRAAKHVPHMYWLVIHIEGESIIDKMLIAAINHFQSQLQMMNDFQVHIYLATVGDNHFHSQRHAKHLLQGPAA
jgi:hypothetical protein